MPADGGLIVGYPQQRSRMPPGAWWIAGSTSSSTASPPLVARRMGDGPLLQLERNPRDEQVQRELGMTIGRAVTTDPGFARELAKVITELDDRDGRGNLNRVYAELNVQVFHRGQPVPDFYYFNPLDYTSDPAWIKVCVALGTILGVVAFGIFGSTFFTADHDESLAPGWATR